MEDLALFGGQPAFLQNVLVGRPSIGDRARFFDRLDWALSNRWLSNGGPLVQEFEGRIAEQAGVRNCVATCNATVGLQLLLRGLGLHGRVIVPSLTFVATAQAVSWIGLEPVFCDIDPDTGCLDPAAVEAAIGPGTTGIIGVHLWGRTGGLAELEKIAAANDVRLVFDAAHALGCTAGGRAVGGFGAAEVFSFHATKVVNSFEGGAVVTDDDELARRLRAMQNFGFESAGVAAHVGTNAKMSEASAAMGLTSLDAFDEVVRHNSGTYELYAAELAGVRGLRLIQFDTRERNNFQYVVILVDAAAEGLERDALLDVLRAENVVAQKYFSPGVHRMPAYRSDQGPDLPITDRLAAQVIALPTGPAVSREDVRRICDIARVAAGAGHQVTARWRERAGAVPARTDGSL